MSGSPKASEKGPEQAMVRAAPVLRTSPPPQPPRPLTPSLPQAQHACRPARPRAGTAPGGGPAPGSVPFLALAAPSSPPARPEIPPARQLLGA